MLNLQAISKDSDSSKSNSHELFDSLEKLKFTLMLVSKKVNKLDESKEQILNPDALTISKVATHCNTSPTKLRRHRQRFEDSFTKGMEELKKRVQKRSRRNPTNIFLGYSGHGTSMNGQLFLTLPTKLTQEEYIEMFKDLYFLVNNLPVKGNDLKKFRKLREKIDRNFLEKTFEVAEKVNEKDKNELREFIGKF